MLTLAEQHHFMLEALACSRGALPDCRPNPPVGCVLVDPVAHRVVARGHTGPPGQHHAEAQVLADYPGAIDEFALLVTLEPCAFHGRTPSCARAITRRPPGAVFVAMLDPDPRNSGRGIDILRAADIPVTIGIAEEVVAAFLTPYLTGG